MENAAKIFIVEDEIIVSMEIQDRLRGLGYTVCGAAVSGEQAIQRAMETQPDLVLMDIMLKGEMDGVEAAKKILSSYDIPIVFLTAHSDKATLQRAKITGPFGYLLKPFDERSLHTTIEMAIYRHDMERQLKESRQWFATTLSSIGDAVIATDAKGRIQFMNKVAESLTAWSQSEVLNKKLDNVLNIVNEKDRSPVEDPVRRVLREGVILGFSNHTILISKDGSEKHIVESAAPIKDEKDNITGVVFVFRDITEQRNLEAQFHQAQKMESVGMLAGGMAHDFNNILGAILGYASFIKMSISTDHPHYKYIDIIEKSAVRGAELTSQLLVFARGEQCKIKSTNLNNSVKETLKIINRTFDKDIEINTHLHQDLPTINADEGQILQLLMNLCVNARDAMPNGGRLIIETSTTELNGHCVEKPIEAKSGFYVRLSVTDTGMGMDKATLQRIFEPFFTTKERGKGTGLGLSMVYGVVKNHEGYVRVYSEPDEGTTFKVYLPVSGKLEEKSQSKFIELQGGNELILVVDDEESFRSFVQDCLEDYGYRVLLAENGIVAIDLFQKHKDEINLVILDLIMPKLGGRETFLKLKELNPQVKALLSTGFSQHGKTKEILDSGVKGFIQKPYQVNDLLIMMRSVLDGNSEFENVACEG